MKRPSLLARTAIAAFALCLTTTGVAAASPVFQVRDAGKLKCSGTLVSAQWVLTSRHCVTHSGAVLAPASLSVAKSRTTPAFTVTKVATAPTRHGHKPDLALLHLATSSSTTPASLPPVGYRLNHLWMHSTGWKSARHRKTVRGHRVPIKSCGKHPGGMVCVHLRHRVPSQTCHNANGASLKNHGFLVGVGSRSHRGCNKRVRATYTRLNRNVVLAWITLTVAPPGGGGGGGGGGGHGHGQPYYVGTFTGPIQQMDGTTITYPATIKITKSGSSGQQIGTSTYAGSGACSGTLTVQSNLTNGVALLEHITPGQRCIDGGTVTITPAAGGADGVHYAWTKGPNDGTAGGDLLRVH